MVKVTSSLLVGAALFASSSTLAAPTRFKRSTEVAASTDLLEGQDEAELVDEVTAALGVDQQTGSVGQMIADNLRKRDSQRTGSDAIRRGLPLTPNSASDLAKRESVVAKLGLTGALSPLGLGPLIPTVQGLVDGLPVVGGPVGGLVKTVDGTVGVSDLLNKPKTKRELLDSLLGATGGAGGALGGLGGLGGLTSALPLGSLTSALPLGGALDTGSSTINGLLGQLQGAGASNSQLAGVLGQLQGLGLGSLPLSALTGSVSSTTGSIQQQADTATSSTPSPANVQQATSILQGLTVAQAEQYGLLPSGTTGRLLNQIEAAIPDQSSTANNLASSVTGRTYGFKAQAGSNETTTDTESSVPAEDQGGATPTFAIASPEAVASAISAGGVEPSGSANPETPSSTSAAEMSKRTAIPSSASSMTPAASSTASSSTAKPTSDSMDDSASDYSDDDEDWEDSDMSDTEEPATPPPARLARRSEENAEPDSEMSKKHHGGTEAQGPHASGAWHATESSSMAATQSQAIATAEAMTYTYSDASATAVPTTAPSKRSYADLD